MLIRSGSRPKEEALNLLNASLRLGEVAFYPGPAGPDARLSFASEAAGKAFKAAASLLGMGDMVGT